MSRVVTGTLTEPDLDSFDGVIRFSAEQSSTGVAVTTVGEIAVVAGAYTGTIVDGVYTVTLHYFDPARREKRLATLGKGVVVQAGDPVDVIFLCGLSEIPTPATQLAIDEAVAAHEASLDPHPQYKDTNPDFITFNLAPETISTDQGTLSWNPDELTLDLIQNGTTGQLFQELQYPPVRNTSGAPILNGTPVMATGAIGASGRITIAPMDGTVASNSKFFLGLATEDIADGEDGKVTTFGKVRRVDTTDFSPGVVWLSSTVVGGLTSVKPTAPAMAMAVAYVVVSHTNGTLQVRVNNLDYNEFEARAGGEYDVRTDLVAPAGGTVTLDYTLGNAFSVDASALTSGQGFILAVSNWPSEPAYSYLALQLLVGAAADLNITWPTGVAPPVLSASKRNRFTLSSWDNGTTTDLDSRGAL